MSDSVKFIFKTIIKVPFFIMVSYLIANLFFFSIFYFKFLGISYSVMQTAMENNYIPATERESIEKSINNIVNGSEIISNARIIGADTKRQQYGAETTVGVAYTYKWIWPLMPEEFGQTAANLDLAADGGDILADGMGQSSLLHGKSNYSDSQLDSFREDKAARGEIKIVYTVPGLQYYSDLE